MRFSKVTVLVYADKRKINAGMRAISFDEYKEISRNNSSLPADKKRFFICDSVGGSGGKRDVIFRETDKETYRIWHNNHENSRKRFKKYVDDIDGDKGPTKRKDARGQDMFIGRGNKYVDVEAIQDPVDFTDEIEGKIMIEELRSKLRAWRPWAEEMLDLALDEEYRHCTSHLAKKYGLSENTINWRKKQFKKFVKEFFMI